MEALQAKIRSDEAESEGCGDPTVEDDNKRLGGFSPQPGGTGPGFPHFFVARRKDTPGICLSSLLELSKTGSRRRHSSSVNRP